MPHLLDGRPSSGPALSPTLRDELVQNIADRLPLFVQRYDRVEEARALRMAFAEDVLAMVRALARVKGL